MGLYGRLVSMLSVTDRYKTGNKFRLVAVLCSLKFQYSFESRKSATCMVLIP